MDALTAFGRDMDALTAFGRDMDALTGFGLFAVTLMLVTYALEERHPAYVLARLRAWLGVRLPAGSLAIWHGGGDLERRGPEALVWAPKISPGCHIKVAEPHEISVLGAARG